MILECIIQAGMAPSHKDTPTGLCYRYLNFREPPLPLSPPICGPNDLIFFITGTSPRLSPLYADLSWSVHLYQRSEHFTQGKSSNYSEYWPRCSFKGIFISHRHLALLRSDFLKKILFIYSWETERQREAETQAEGEAGKQAGSMQGAWRRTWSRVSRIRPWAEGSTKLLSHPGAPISHFYLAKFILLWSRNSNWMEPHH